MGHIWGKKSDLGHFSLQCELSLTVILLQHCFLLDVISQMCFSAGERETMPYFASHFEQQVQIYQKLVRCV